MGSWRKEVGGANAPEVGAGTALPVGSQGAVINRDGDVKLGLVSSARKGNSRDY